MKVSIGWTRYYVDTTCGEIEVPDDATDEQIIEAATQAIKDQQVISMPDKTGASWDCDDYVDWTVLDANGEPTDRVGDFQQ